MSQYPTMDQARLPQATLEPGARPTREHYLRAALRLEADDRRLEAARYRKVLMLLDFAPKTHSP